MNFKKLIGVIMSVVLVSSLTACSGGAKTDDKAPAADSAKKYTFNLAIDSPEDTVTFLYADKFKQLLAEKSDGRMVVQVYSNGQMGGDKEITESVQAGNIDFGVQNTAPQVNFVPELAVFDMPSSLPDIKTARAVLDGPFYEKIQAVYEKSGFKLLGMADQGFREMSTNKKVTTMADFSGQKIRTMQNPYHVAYWKALGANPTPMAFSEVYIGLQQGTIDAQENPYETIVSAKLYEQQKYIINTNHIFHLVTLIGNPEKFKALSTEDQKIMTESAKEATVWAREQADKRVADRVKIMTDSGTEIVEITPELQAAMAAKAEGVYNTIRSEIGDELPDALLAAVKAAK